MDVPENFKFDVRIRARMLAKGNLAEADVHKHLESLQDLAPSVDAIDVSQPAVGTPAERPVLPPRPRPEPRPAPFVQPPSERSQPRSIAPGPLAVDEGWDEDDDDEDDLDEEEDSDEAEDKAPAKPPVAAAPPPPPVKAEEPDEAEEESAAPADDDEDSVDDEDAVKDDGEEE